MLKKTYWDSTGTYQAVYDQLNELIPLSGPVPHGRGRNKALERLRRAGNCYYDLYNNGLINRATEFRREFGFGGTCIAKTRYRDELKMQAVEDVLDRIILAAAREQNLSV